MAVSQTQLEPRAIELSTEAFQAFCEDISGMFMVDMNCKAQEASVEKIDNLKKRFRKLSAVINVKTIGALDGTFHLIFDQGGLFTLSGIIVMLPEKRIIEEIKRGTIKDVESMNDAVGEVGNLCVGSWDKIFREEFEGHGHFVQDGTYIGNPWDNPEENIKLPKNEELVFVPFEMTAGEYPAFNCAAAFPKSLFEPHLESATENAQPEAEQNQDETAENIELTSDNKTEYAQEAGTSIETDNEEVQSESAETEEAISDENKSETVSEGTISETIKRITQSPAVLPGQSKQFSLSATAAEIMNKNIVWFSPDECVQKAIEKMQQHDTGYLLIGNENSLEGIVSKSDIAGAVSPYLKTMFSKWRRPLDDATLQIKIKWIMSRPVRTIKPDASIINVMENMRQFGNRCLPVMNQDGKIEGLITVFDIFRTIGSYMNISTAGKTSQAPSLI